MSMKKLLKFTIHIHLFSFLGSLLYPTIHGYEIRWYDLFL